MHHKPPFDRGYYRGLSSPLSCLPLGGGIAQRKEPELQEVTIRTKALPEKFSPSGRFVLWSRRTAANSISTVALRFIKCGVSAA